jgi:NAD-dependent dihydropyrimidine dehydrogenase PreA subunit
MPQAGISITKTRSVTLNRSDLIPVNERFPGSVQPPGPFDVLIFSIVTINEGKGQHDHSMLKVHRDICGYCGCCVSVCPEGALELIDAYLSVEPNCTSCGICAKVCPLGALEVVNEE